jgi:hypothetical protein
MEKESSCQGIRETYTELWKNFAVDSEVDWTFQWKVEHVNHLKDSVEFEVLAAEIMKSSIFWDVTPYSNLKINFQRTTRRYIPEDTSLHTFLLYYKMFLRFIWYTTTFTFLRKIFATIQKNRRDYVDVSHFCTTCDFCNSVWVSSQTQQCKPKQL